MELRNLFPVAGALGAAFFLIADAGAAPSLPASLNGFVHYSTSNYGGKISDKYVQKTSIQALQSGKTLPYGTAVVGIEYRDQNGKRGEERREGLSGLCPKRRLGVRFLYSCPCPDHE